MGQALYRKYRSKSLDEIAGQAHITATLKNALKTGNISHAYLLTGPRGVGKTSVARILAHAINDLKYEDDTLHLDIIEIDAASNRRIDEIRDLRDKVHISPTSAKYKVYIIDEVHMLTKEAFNALLKTLEEPPAHVIFILATTEAHKLPETIISRTQRFSFKPIQKSEIIKQLQMIAKKEKITVDNDALELLAEHGEGSFRDSIGLLDQASSTSSHITSSEVLHLLGIAPMEAIDRLVESLGSATPKEIIGQLEALRDQGFGAGQIAKQLASVLRVKAASGQADNKTMKLLKKLLDVPAHSQPQLLLEIILLESVLAAPSIQPPVVARQEAKKEPVPEDKPASIRKAKPASTFSLDSWPNVLSKIKEQHNSLYGILHIAKPSYDGKTLTLAFQFPFHQKRISDAKNQQIIKDVMQQISSQPVELVCIVDEKPKQTVAKTEVKSDKAVETISNIFGSAELLE
jgi:DNA polymerase-3 subunit gamma/tau